MVVIAGFGVTTLIDPVTKRTVWGTPRSVWTKRFPDDLELDPNDRLVPGNWVGSRGPINTGWQLSIALRKWGGYTLDRDLHPFYYDWRRDARENARLLDAFIDRIRNNGEVDLVTHSAGALVALASSQEHVRNIVMVAPPRHGVVDAFRLFVQPERFIRRTFGPQFVATWPFLFELLPENGRVFVDEEGHPLERDLWNPADWPLDIRAQLESARAFREELRTKTPRAKITVLAGDCVPTAKRILQRRDGTYVFYADDLRPTEQHLAPVLFEPGDGTVPVSSAGEALLFCDGHQGIAADPNVHRAIIRALRF
ncbi:MAG: alpha/beta hydrolase [Acidobacteriota bacterium]|nr:alpha/beta hydrolase [Acidobacteriota bacterium]